ncbi:hypothetical protein ACEUDP_16870 [Aeromonas caviae]|uniref:hypothetical protein n=1 Tax=Aeromonas caviae TaxID=648 RepID=UPI0038D177E4
MISAVLTIELEAYRECHDHIEVVHDQGQTVDGYALYLRYENERGDALAQWLCDHPDHCWLTQFGTLTSHQLPHSAARLHTLAA